MAKLTHEEFDRRVREAMIPKPTQGGGNFAPGIQQLRQSVGKRRQLTPRKPISAS